jgi:hypothetical protein
MVLEIIEKEGKVQLIDIDEMSVEELKSTYELMGNNLGIFQTNIKGINAQIDNHKNMVKIQEDRKVQEEKNIDLTMSRMNQIRSFLKSKGINVKKADNYLKSDKKTK